MQKKQIFKITVVSLAVLCVAVQVSVGQSPPTWVDSSNSNFGARNLPSYIAPDVVVEQPTGFGMPEASADTIKQTAFRVTVIPDEKETLPVAFTPQEESEDLEVPAPPMIEPLASDKCSGACQGSCDGSCDQKFDVKGCGCVGECCCFSVRVYGEYLLLRARDAEVVYAVEANSNDYEMLGPEYPVQISPFGVLDQDTSSGFRFGFGVAVDNCSEIAATYTWFDSATSHEIANSSQIPNIVPMSAHPATLTGISSSFYGLGRHDISFETLDLDFRRTFYETECSEMTYVVGARWGQLEQVYNASYRDDLVQTTNALDVETDIDFSGGGIHLGLEGERTGCCCGIPLLVYAKGVTSLLAGEFDATYIQTAQNGATQQVDTGWKAGRIVPTFDLEIGGGIMSHGGLFRATIGYVYSSWGNTVKTEDWVRAVQTNNPKDMSDTMTFDGLVGRIEARF
jgi:hypothetical protein